MELPKFSAEEIRVLGVLIEKEALTPDQYPLTLNATRVACNQKTSREPVVAYEEAKVRRVLRHLMERGFVRETSEPGSRVSHYRHLADSVFGLSKRELALISMLLLRGPQTLNELKTRTERQFAFENLEDVEHSLERLRGRNPALVMKLGRAYGQREDRYATTLRLEDEISERESIERPVDTNLSICEPSPGLEERLAALEERVTELEVRLEALKS